MKFAMNKLVSILLMLYSAFLLSSQDEYIYPSNAISFSNYGTSGLIQIPSARFHPGGTLAFNWVDNEPYQRGSIIAYPFDWLEASYQYTDIENALYSLSPGFSGDQTYKDKSFDAKIRLFQETDLMPAIAFGSRDLGGTGIFSSEYFVASKRINNVDFSLGMGWGILSGGQKITNPFGYISEQFEERTGQADDSQGGDFNFGSFFSGPAAIFAGAEIFLPNLNGSRLKIEYDGVDYEEEGFPNGAEDFDLAFKPIDKKQESKFNIGFVYPVTEGAHFKLSWTKGNTLSFGFSINANFSKENPSVKKRDNLIPISNGPAIKKANEIQDLYLYRNALKYLNQNRLYLHKASLENDQLEIAYQQNKYIKYAQSTGRVAKILDEISPDSITKFKITNLNAGIPMHSVVIDRNSLQLYESQKYSTPLKKDIAVLRGDKNTVYKYEPTIKKPAIFWSIAPSLRSQIGGPDGFYFGDLAVAFHSETLFASNLTLSVSAQAGLVDNFEGLKLASDSLLPHVRTDQVFYLKQSKDFNIPRLQLNYFTNLSKDLYGKIAIGYLESMFGGVGGEILYRPFHQSFAIGAELWRVRQRDFNMIFKFRDYETTTGHINVYYEEPNTNIVFALKGGKFLAQDSGITVDFHRRFQSGARIGAFFSLTDISKYEFGEGSFDKGFYFYIPIEYFFSNHSKPLTGFGLRPIQRDGAQALVHAKHLYGVTDQAQEFNVMRDWGYVYD